MTDEQIIERFFERDESAISETDKKYGAYCMKISQNILCDTLDCEENVSDTYLKLWQSIPPEKPKIFKAYIARIARNLALNKLSKSHAAKRAADEFALSLDEVDICTPSNINVEDTAAVRELSERISVFLHSESEASRRIFVCRYFYCESVKEIADRFSYSQSRVKSSLMRTRERLAAFLEKEGYSLEK